MIRDRLVAIGCFCVLGLVANWLAGGTKDVIAAEPSVATVQNEDPVTRLAASIDSHISAR